MELSGIKDIGELSKDIKNNPSKYTKLISK